jgi:hypothetical protein
VQPFRREIREQVLEVRLLVSLEAETDDGCTLRLVEFQRPTREDGE